MSVLFAKPARPKRMHHVVVYRREDEFSSWPFNGGMWKVDENNILVAFMNHKCDYTIPGNLSHNRIETFGRIALARTADQGQTWQDPVTLAKNLEVTERILYGREENSEPVDFFDPNVLLCCWSSPNSSDERAKAWIKISQDGGRTWGKARRIPSFHFLRIQGRPSYILRPDGVLLLMLTAQGKNDPHDRPVVYASYDGGCNWTHMSYIAGSKDYRMICPSPIILKNGRIIASVRCKPTVFTGWTETYFSDDGGRTWSFLSRVNDSGAPGHLTLLKDGRIFCVYGYRRPPYGIRARISEDEGRSWGREWIIRDDGGSFDLGYPRAVELSDNRVLMVYYFNDASDPVQANGGIRYIGATILELP